MKCLTILYSAQYPKRMDPEQQIIFFEDTNIAKTFINLTGRSKYIKLCLLDFVALRS